MRDISGSECASSTSRREPFSAAEARIETATGNVIRHVAAARGHFVRDEQNLAIALPAGLVRLTSQTNSVRLAKLLIDGTGITLCTPVGRSVVQRLMVHAHDHGTAIRIRSLAAASGHEVYLPTSSGRLLQISADGFALVDNGQNPGRWWVEHPGESGPLQLSDVHHLPQATVAVATLRMFEEVIVQTQACVDESLRWFVAFNGCFVPLVRDWLEARFIVLHVGPSQSGKTTGARRFVRYHGLTDVHGDVSVAALSNGADRGFVVLDNREQLDCSRELLNYLLFLATGAVRGRSDTEGNVRESRSRPITHMTSIEGVHSDELARRCIVVDYYIRGERVDNDNIDQAIAAHGNQFAAAGALVLQRLLQIRAEPGRAEARVPERASGFATHYRLLCDLAQAFGDVSGRDPEWASGLTSSWHAALNRTRIEHESVLENGLRTAALGGLLGTPISATVGGSAGKLFVTDAAKVHSLLSQLVGQRFEFPKTPAGLARRIRSEEFMAVTILDGESAPNISELRRTTHRRPIGIFVPAESGLDAPTPETGKWPPSSTLREVGRELYCQHSYLSTADRLRYVWEYTPKDGSAVERFLHAFKSLTNDTAKLLAIGYAARCLAGVLPENLRDWVFVPMPCSGAIEDVRLDRMLQLVAPALDVRPLLAQVRPIARGIKGLSVSDRVANLKVNKELIAPEPKGIVIVDDVVASGCHLRAAREALNELLPGVPTVGIALFRRAVESERSSLALGASASG